MDWAKFVALLRQYPKATVAGVVAIFVVGSSAGSYMFYAEQCHAQAQSNEVVIQDLLEYQRREIEREKAAVAEERRKKQYISKLCLTKKLTDPEECAKVGIQVEQ